MQPDWMTDGQAPACRARAGKEQQKSEGRDYGRQTGPACACRWTTPSLLKKQEEEGKETKILMPVPGRTCGQRDVTGAGQQRLLCLHVFPVTRQERDRVMT